MNKTDIKTRIDARLEQSFVIEDGWGDIDLESEPAGIGFAHVPARGTLEALFLTNSSCSYKGHYVDGRMHPCARQACKYCITGKGNQPRWVFAIYDIQRGSTRLLEVGKEPAKLLLNFERDYNSLVGLTFRFSKPGGTIRSTILITLVSAARTPISDLPDIPNVAEILRKIWSDQISSKVLKS